MIIKKDGLKIQITDDETRGKLEEESVQANLLYVMLDYLVAISGALTVILEQQAVLFDENKGRKIVTH